jgi:hypothetical protein
MMNGFFKILVTKIREYEGPIDKFTDDRLSYFDDLTYKLDV